MNEIYVRDIVKVCDGKLISGSENFICENFSNDTRRINPGDVYIGIKGEKFDGSLFWKEALEKGAGCIMVQGIEISRETIERFPDRAIILVEDTLIAIQKLAAYKRSLYNIPVIAITGSVGKTSTKDLVSSVVAQKYRCLKTEGNYNNHIGVPLTLLRLKNEEVAVIEMGMNHFGEISLLTNIVKPTIAIITNIGTAHIGNLGSREHILKAKLEILEGLAENGTIIINQDNDLLEKWYEQVENKENIRTYGIKSDCELKAYDVNITEKGSSYKIKIREQEYEIKVPISGEPFVYNSLCSLAVADVLEIPMEQSKEGIKTFELTKKRMDIEELRCGVTVINDSYNASLDSVKAGLEYLRMYKGNKKIAVLGDMLELGEFSKQLHCEVGEAVVQEKIDKLIAVGSFAKYIVEEAERKGMSTKNIYLCATNEEAAKILQTQMNEGDVILLKAANAMKFSEILEKIRS